MKFIQRQRTFACICERQVIAFAFSVVLAMMIGESLMAQETESPAVLPPANSTYRILPRPLPEHIGKHLPYSTTNQPSTGSNYESRPTEPYSYGWFGSESSPQWSRHFGYSRRYTQWSLK
jgi:hypothetical protein